MKPRIGLLVVCLCWSALGQKQYAAAGSEARHVLNNVVFISPEEKFGVNLAATAEGMPLTISEEPDPKKANLVLSFKQEKGMMLFTIENRTEHWLAYEAGMSVPKRDGFYKTSVLPVGPHLFSLESWPHAIDRLALKNFSFTEKPGGKPDNK